MWDRFKSNAVVLSSQKATDLRQHSDHRDSTSSFRGGNTYSINRTGTDNSNSSRDSGGGAAMRRYNSRATGGRRSSTARGGSVDNTAASAGEFAQNHWHTRGVSGGNKAYSYSIRAGPAPPRPPRPSGEQFNLFKDPNSRPPQSDPAVPRPPKNLEHLRSSQYRPPSSVYSEASPRNSHFVLLPTVEDHTRYNSNAGINVNVRHRVADDNDVSPPSSPEVEVQSHTNVHHDSAGISPIDENPGMSQLDARDARPGSQSQGRSNIPMMRRERRKNQGQAANTLREEKSKDRLVIREKPSNSSTLRQHHDPRWDPLTGEITTNSEVGRPSQVPKPSQYAQGLGISGNHRGSKIPRSPTSPESPIPTFGERVRRKIPGRGNNNNSPSSSSNNNRRVSAGEGVVDPGTILMSSDNRPPWQGASGRTTLVPSVKDTPDVAPLKIPPKSNRRAITAAAAILGSASPPVSPETSGYAIEGNENTTHSRPHANQQSSAQAYPSPPNSGAEDPLNTSVASRADLPVTVVSDAGTRYGGVGGTSAALPHHSSHSPHHEMIHGSPSSPSSPSAGDHQISSKTTSRLDPPQRQAITKSWSSSVYSTATTAPGVPDVETYPLPPLPNNPSYAVEQPESSSNAATGATPDQWNQPPSRFSVTTYEPSPNPSHNIDFHSTPPMPTAPQHFLAPSGAAGPSVLDRGRPKYNNESIGAKPLADKNPLSDPVLINMNTPVFVASPTKTGPLRSNPILHPTQSGTWDSSSGFVAGALSRGTSSSPYAVPRTVSSPLAQVESNLSLNINVNNLNKPHRSSTSSSTNKDLPPVPPELAVNNQGDRVEMLKARLKALANRKINIDMSIEQMTKLMPADNLMASAEVLVKRAREKKKVEVLTEELAEVKREEHELGLKLHRAHKRMDREANYESTSLWVSRAGDK